MASIDYAHSTRSVSLLSRIGSSLKSAMTAYVEARSRSDQISRLNAKTDAELARMGLKRDDIVRYVFRDTLYI